MIGKWVEQRYLATPILNRVYLDHYVTIKRLEKQVFQRRVDSDEWTLRRTDQ